MSTVDPGATGTILQNYRLIQRVSPSVWKAEDTRTGKTVAVKILSKGLPKDPAKREALIREVRQSAALYHSFLVGIQELTAVGESLLLVMEWLDGQSIGERAKTKVLDRQEFFRVFYQIGDALKLLHGRNLVHGNIAGDSIILLPSGQAKLAGLNIGNMMPRQGQPSQFQQKGADIKAVSYMAPEQITAQAVGPMTDVFSIGVVMYEAATGKLPYLAATAGDVAHKIVNENPASPKAANPNIDNSILSLMGGSLFKDSFKRFKDAKALVDAINRLDVDASKFAAEVAKAAAAPPAGSQITAIAKGAILFIADVANYDELQSTNPAAAAKSAARMQQILSEAVYLFDGKVLDPFGPRMIAELATVDAAVEAGRKGEFDFSQDQQEGEVIPVRMLLHAGEIQARDGSVTGPGVDKALAVLPHLPPLVLHVTEDFARKGKAQVRYRDAGAKGGVKLATIVPPEPKVEHETAVDTAVEEAAAVEEARREEAAAAEAAAAKKKKQRTMMMGLAAAVVVVIAGAIAMLMRRNPDAATAAASKPKLAAAAPISASNPRKVLLDISGADPAVADRANAIRLVVTSVLASFPELRIADSAGPDVSGFSAKVQTGTAGPEIVVGTSPPAPVTDVAGGVEPVLQYVTSQLKIPMRGAAAPQAYNAYADAIAAQGLNDAPKQDAALRAAMKADPNFLPAQLMAMKFFTDQKKPFDAVEAAKHVLAAQPDNLDAARMVARTSLSTGDLASAFTGYAAILRKNPDDAEALNAVGRYAVAAGDIPKLSAVLKRLKSAPGKAEVHEPDALLAAGRIDQAVDRYYTVEEAVPNNPALSLKIGRIAVLRHSMPIAELELKKLETSDPLYGVHILKAYLAAQSGNKAGAEEELKTAFTASTPGDDYWTSVAEVQALAGNTTGILDALERAAIRKEPSAAYVMNDPLFSFLESDPRFQKIKESFLAQQNEIRSALATVSL
jgi:tetratricopeptide (TPR) repeat protein